jgi:5-formyltetrahydrofolate cyclo-ligase
LQTGAFGLDEPIARDAADLAGLDAVIVPMVAFDRQGSRLGYGKGFYDAFLRELPRETKRIGLAFAVQEVPHIPVLSHDEPIGRIITESEDIITAHA